MEEEKETAVEDLRELASYGKGLEILKGLMKDRTRVRTFEDRKKTVESRTYVRRNLDWQCIESGGLWI